jgi:hypothetical protein
MCASKRGVRRRSCEAKRAYEEEGEARAHANILRLKGHGELHHYLCSNCGHWHVGHKPGAIKTNISAKRRVE